MKAYKTKHGQAIVPYTGADKHFSTKRTSENWAKEQRLCQILPPIPQRFEWINTENIVEVKAS